MADVDVLIVAGGGGGGNGLATVGGGGGGAGGVRVLALAAPPSSVSVTIGPGGSTGFNGSDSAFGAELSLGGGRGARNNQSSQIGGSGGGGVYQTPASAGTAGQGFAGGAGSDVGTGYGSGGGGGAGAAGAAGTASTGGNGGGGLSNDFSGVATVYGGGGGGGAAAGTVGAGGSGGGGNAGGVGGTLPGSPGAANRGGGGGGGGVGSGLGGSGGSGIVIARYLTANFTGTGGTVTTSGPYTIHTFTGSGTFTMAATPRGLEAAAAIRIASAAAITTGIYLHAAAAIAVASAASLSTAPASFTSSSTITFASSAALTTGVRLVAGAGIRFSASASFVPSTMLASSGITIGTRATISRGPRETIAGIVIDGVDVKGRVRMAGLTIHDILNDAPNTCSLVIEGDGPAVGQRIRITLNEGSRVLFSGQVQTVDQSFEGKPIHVAWHVTAIDDTAEANARRPFGVWVDTSATVVAQALATAFAPGFSVAGIAADLPPVSFVFDGSDTLIAALVKLANAIGGYAKIEDGTIYLFLVDTEAAPDPIDESHRFLFNPPILANIDASQLRTRVYGKGYGEHIRADLAPGETLIPIDDGVLFPEFGGLAVASTTPNAPTSEHLAYTGRELAGGGTLVGPGAGPTVAPLLAVQPGTGVDNGRHDVAVVFVTATGKSLAGPFASVDVPYFPPPSTAPIAAPAINGTGPDQGSHEYAVSLSTAFGETVLSPISNPITTSAAVGQIAPPSSGPYASDATAGSGVPDGLHAYAATFVNASGETQLGPGNWNAAAGPRLVGQIPNGYATPPTATPALGAGVDAGQQSWKVTFGDGHGDTGIGDSQERVITVGNGPQLPTPSGYMTATRAAGGSIGTGESYWWRVSFGDSVGESLMSGASNNGTAVAIVAGQQSVNLTNIPIGPAGTSKRFIYRSSSFSPQDHLVATINDNTTTAITDGLANASVGRLHPGGNTSGEPYHVINLTNIPIGPSGTTNRKVWRWSAGAGAYKYVGTINDNLTTTLTDSTPTASLGANAPTSNTTGSTVPYNQNQVVGIPIGAAGTTARKLYRQNGLSGPFGFIATINDNTTTIYLDTKSTIGATGPTSNTTGTAVQRIPVSSIPIGPPGTVSRNLYRRFNGAGPFKLVTTLANNTTTTFTDSVANSALGAAALATPTAVGNQIAVSAIPIGAAAVTARELYMSPVGTPTRRLALVIANNTATAAILTASDATLGAAAIEPSADTSGLQQPQGQVNPGSTVLPLAAAATFRSDGGWVILGGGQVVRYTGITAQTLTGIPADGAGAITTTVLYGSQAIPAPMLVGVTGILVPILRGSAVHIWVQRDDLLAQAEQRARAGGDGVIEFLIVDTARDQPGIMARCDADLALFSRPLVTVAYATRDLNTKSGKQVAISLTSPRIAEVLTIQDVTITEIDLARGLAPRFSVRASSVRFSLEDTLRRLIAGGQIVGGSS